MSVQFGRWNFDGQPPAPDYIQKVDATLAPYGPDSDEAYRDGGVRILYRAFHTTPQSHLERQPHLSPSGAVITWDGRLDNREDLIIRLGESLTSGTTDLDIVSASFERWGTDCFGKLIGDWALSIWNPGNSSLILAIDPIGTRHLYYSFDDKQITWSTILDPLVRFSDKTLTICEEYIAGWLSYFPAAHLTPYVGIYAVPPSHLVLLHRGRRICSNHWDFDPNKEVCYRTDAEYEEHFRAAFATAVQRRLRSDRPVLAELSGGLDSSSIVCMADTVALRGATDTSNLDTISWYDDSYDHVEPDANELHWITKVEEKRGQAGWHVNLRSLETCHRSPTPFPFDFADAPFESTPTTTKVSVLFKEYAAYMASRGHRVTLSGIGGNEVTFGDTPTPTAEFQNLIARAQISVLVRRLNAWSIKMRKARIPLLLRAARGFVSRSLTGISMEMTIPPWLGRAFTQRNYAALCGYPNRVKLFGPLPSFQENMVTLNVLRRLLAQWALQSQMLREVRFPFLDRDLLEFLYAIPREQNTEVGKRRFLMKRALVNIVPAEILNRRRKAFAPPVPLDNDKANWPNSTATDPLISSSAAYIDPDRFCDALRIAKQHENLPTDLLRQALTLERWLRRLRMEGVLTDSTPRET